MSTFYKIRTEATEMDREDNKNNHTPIFKDKETEIFNFAFKLCEI